MAAVAAPAVLTVADGVLLAVDYVTKVCAILAQRRKGKSYTAAVIAEELFEAGLPWAALDPTGAWWGLRSSADGAHPGLPVVVIGGQHGDLPLERGAGAFIADLVLDHPGWYVIDLSLLDSRAAEREFATAFGERLLRRKMQAGMDFPFHLFIDEADMFLPQEKETRGDVALLAAYSGIVRRGGLHGLGSTLISQRPALINKNALTQLDLLVLLRLVSGNDQDAVRKNYVSRFMEKPEADELMASLASLPVGEGWFLEPGDDPPLRVCARVRERRTFNSSATPKAGERRVEPSVFAEVDLDELRDRMAETVERAKADDPAELRCRLRELQRLVDARQDGMTPGNTDARPGWEAWFRARGWIPAAEAPEPEPVPAVTHDDTAKILAISRILQDGHGQVERAYDALRGVLEGVSERLAAPAPPPPSPAPPPVRPPRAAPAPAPADPPAPEGGVLNRRAERVLLDALAQHPEGLSARQAAIISGYKLTGGGFRGAVTRLRVLGYIEGGSDLLRATEAGRDAAGDPAPMPTGRALYDEWMRRLNRKAEREVLTVLYEAGEPMSPADVADRAGYEVGGGGFRGAVTKLATLNLIERRSGSLQASDTLYGS